MADSGQKFIGRNRAPRVQIEYDVEIYGAEKKVQLPFVMGVMADLSAKSKVPLQHLSERKFLEFDMDNFDDRMKAIKPRLEMKVADKLGDDPEKLLPVSIEFESMDDFSPGRVVEKLTAGGEGAESRPLAELMEQRRKLSDLIAAMDGRAGAEDLVWEVLNEARSIMRDDGSKPES